MREDAVDELADPANLTPVASCALCGSRDQRVQVRDGQFSVVRCAACGLGYVSPRLEAELLPRVYDEDYWSSDRPSLRGYDDYRAQSSLYLRTFEKRYRLVEEVAPVPGRALDVGCAAGFFLHVLAGHSWDVAGVEPSADIAKYAEDTYGLQVHVGDLESAPYPRVSFDLVTMWDVLEHVPDPVGFLETARTFLVDDGLLILETQNIDSRFAKLLGKRWHHYKHLEHLYHFNPSTITDALTRGGFRVEQITPKYGGKHVSVGFVRERSSRLPRIAQLALRPLALVDRASFYVNVRDEMVVVARKAR